MIRTSKICRASMLLAAALAIGVAGAAQACVSPQLAGQHTSNSNGTQCGNGSGGQLPPPAINPRGSYNGGLGIYANGGGDITVPGGGGGGGKCPGLADGYCHAVQ